jgi:hypothetical protein
MQIFFHKFSLSPKKAINRLGSMDSRDGVFLKSLSDHGVGYCEYFPHSEWGDLSVDEFLETFALQKNETQKKAHYFLDPRFTREESKSFFNHCFYQEPLREYCQKVKYKIKDEKDLRFLTLLESCDMIRLDANGLFNQQTWETFFKQIPTDLRMRIEYIEDPLFDQEWSGVTIPRGRDFIHGSPFEYSIYKPYRDFIPEHQASLIFSGNMGHGLANYQSYLELVEYGDLTLYHGLLTPNLYENLPELFDPDASGGFRPNQHQVKTYLTFLGQQAWRSLCTF